MNKEQLGTHLLTIPAEEILDELIRLSMLGELKELSTEEYWLLLKDSWSMSNAHNDRKNNWLYLFNQKPIIPSNTKGLHNEFIIYRAGDSKGLSWTLSREKANWFQKRNKLFESTEPNLKDIVNEIWFISTTRKKVFFYTDAREEKEVVLDPEFLMPMKYSG